jgi:hypothetical protein
MNELTCLLERLIFYEIVQSSIYLYFVLYPFGCRGKYKLLVFAFLTASVIHLMFLQGFPHVINLSYYRSTSGSSIFLSSPNICFIWYGITSHSFNMSKPFYLLFLYVFYNWFDAQSLSYSLITSFLIRSFLVTQRLFLNIASLLLPVCFSAFSSATMCDTDSTRWERICFEKGVSL